MDGFEYGQSFKWLLWFLLLEYGFMATLLEPGFLDFDNLPDTNFSCVGKVIGGYYADLETACQMFHVCTIGQLDEPMDIRFLCLNGTVFDQETRVCERIDEVDCAKSEQFYSLNLELYGNTQAPILSESEEQDGGSSSTSTPRTPSTSSEAKVTRQSFIITTAKPTKSTDLYKPHTTQKPSTTSRYQIPINRPPDIRFNPKEINVSLSVKGTANSEPYHERQQSHQHHYYSSSSTEHVTQKPPTKFVRNNPPIVKPTVRISTTTTEGYEAEHFVDFQKEPSHQPILRNNYQYRLNVPNFRPSATGLLRHHQHQHQHQQNTNKYNRPTIFYSPPKNQQQYTSTPLKNHQQRLSVLHPSQSYYHNYKHDYVQTEVPPVKIQLELPTRQPLTFSSPSPFRLSPHNQQKQTNHRSYGHQTPRIVISASASVSDASGRKFNYSLGTIGDSQLFGHAPQSYDDYREEDVGYDPFYHDVLKLNRAGRRKRQVEASSTDAIDTLRFLFEWYNKHKTNGEEDINTKWNSSVRGRDFGPRNEDVIYRSVIDTIKQEGPSSFEEYQEYDKEDSVKSRSKVGNDELRSSNADSSVGMSNNYDYEEEAFTNIETNKTVPQNDSFRIPNFKDQEINEDVVTEPLYINEDYPDIFKQNINPFINTDYTPQNYELKYESKPFSKSSVDDSSYEPINITDITTEESTTKPIEFSKPVEEELSSSPEPNTTAVYSTELDDHVLQITDKYLQVLNILGVTTSQMVANQTVIQLEESTQTSDDVLNLPINTPKLAEPTESLSFTTETITEPTSQIFATTDEYVLNSKQNEGVPTVFGAKVKVEEPTTLEPMTYKEEYSPTTSLQDVLTVAMTTTTLNPILTDKTLILETTESVETTSQLFDTIPTIFVTSTTTVKPRASTASVFRQSNHRFNRFRSNTRSKPQRFTTTKAMTSFDQTLTSSRPETTTKNYTEPNPKLVSQTYTIPEDSKQNFRGKSIDMSSKKGQLKNYIFNCFGKDLNQFYSDPRDCRLFHYCTNGYTSTQLLDMKFVCDSGTFFDSEKLVCTKLKPLRCI